jgi:hypothetical protein
MYVIVTVFEHSPFVKGQKMPGEVHLRSRTFTVTYLKRKINCLLIIDQKWELKIVN